MQKRPRTGGGGAERREERPVPLDEQNRGSQSERVGETRRKLFVGTKNEQI